MTHRDRPGGPTGRRKAAGDAVYHQGFSTPSDGPHGRPERRLAKAFGQRRVRLPIHRIATPNTPSRKPWQAVPTDHYHRSLVLVLLHPHRPYGIVRPLPNAAVAQG